MLDEEVYVLVLFVCLDSQLVIIPNISILLCLAINGLKDCDGGFGCWLLRRILVFSLSLYLSGTILMDML